MRESQKQCRDGHADAALLKAVGFLERRSIGFSVFPDSYSASGCAAEGLEHPLSVGRWRSSIARPDPARGEPVVSKQTGDMPRIANPPQGVASITPQGARS